MLQPLTTYLTTPLQQKTKNKQTNTIQQKNHIQPPPAPLPEAHCSTPAENITTVTPSLSNIMADPRKAPLMLLWNPPLQPKVPLAAPESPPGNRDGEDQSKIAPSTEEISAGP